MKEDLAITYWQRGFLLIKQQKTLLASDSYWNVCVCLWRILGNLLVRNDTGFAALSTNVISQTKLEICLRQSLKPVQFAWNLSSGRSRIRISHKINFLWLRTKIKKFFHPHSVEETTRSVEAPTVDFNITKLKYIIRAHDISCGLRIFKIPEWKRNE